MDYEVFLSYAHADAKEYGQNYIDEIKKQIEESLGGEKLVFLDTQALELGNEWNSKIQSCLDKCKIFICLLSENYIKSAYCTREWLWWAQKEMAKGRLNKATLPIFYIELGNSVNDDVRARFEKLSVLQNDANLAPWFPDGIKYTAPLLVKQRLENAKLLSRIKSIKEDSEKISSSISSIPPYNQKFVGRINELCQIRQICAHSGMAAESIPVIHGEAGCGKSEISFAYAHGYASEYPGGRFFVPMENVKSWSEAWQRLADETDNQFCLPIYEVLGVSKKERQQSTEEFAKIIAQRMWTHILNNGRTLILLDNVDCMPLLSEGGLTEIFPNKLIPENLDLVATTRNTPSISQNSKAVALHLKNLDEETALELLRLHRPASPFNSAPPQDDAETLAAKELLKYLEYHAWSVEIIGGYLLGMGAQNDQAIRCILEQLKENFNIQSDAEFRPIRNVANCTEKLLQPTVDKIKELELGNEMIELAGAAAMFPPDTISIKLLEMLWKKRYEKNLCNTPDSWQTAWKKLTDYHLLSVENKGISRMHRNTQGFFLEYCKAKHRELATDIKDIIEQSDDFVFSANDSKCISGFARFILKQSWKDEFFSDILTWIKAIMLVWYQMEDSRQLLGFLENLIPDTIQTKELYYRLLMCKGQFFRESNLYSEAMETYQKAIEICGEMPENFLNITKAYNAIGILFCSMGEYNKALEFFVKENELLQSNLPENHPELADSYHNIAYVYDSMAQYEKAWEFFEKSLKIEYEIFVEDDPRLATSYDSIGNLCIHIGNFETALRYFEKALDIRKKNFPETHSVIATSYNNIASAYQALSDYNKAFEFYNKTLETDQQILPANHPHLATTYNNLSTVSIYLGNYEEALDYALKSLEIRRNAIPEYHPDIAHNLTNIGYIYFKRKDYETAEKYCCQSLEIAKKSLPVNHPDLARCYNSLSVMYQGIGDFAKALKMSEEALKIKRNIINGNPLDIASSLVNQGGIYTSAKEYEKALENLTEALKIYQENSLENSREAAICYNNFGGAYSGLQDYQNALKYYSKALEIRKNIFPENHPEIVASYNNIGNVYVNIGEYDNALAYHTKCLEINQNLYTEKHPATATDYNTIACIYDRKAEYDKTVEFSIKALKIRENVLPSTHPDLIQSYENAANALYRIGEYKQSLVMLQKILEVKEQVSPENHKEIVQICKNIGLAAYKCQEYDLSLEYCLRVLNIMVEFYPDDLLEIAIFNHNAGNVCHAKKDYDQALEFYNAALKIRQKLLPANHPDLVSSQRMRNIIRIRRSFYGKILSLFSR